MGWVGFGARRVAGRWAGGGACHAKGFPCARPQERGRRIYKYSVTTVDTVANILSLAMRLLLL